MFKTSRRSVVLVIPLLVLGICFGLRISIIGFESPALSGAVQIRPGGTPGQRAVNSQNTQNPIWAPEAGWPRQSRKSKMLRRVGYGLVDLPWKAARNLALSRPGAGFSPG